MDKLVVEGGVRLKGEVEISGSKNASLPILAATLLSSSASRIKNVPRLDDVMTLTTLFRHLGAKVEIDQNDFMVDASTVSSVEATYDIVRKMRASVLVLGPLLARFGRARVSLPGGCAIGARPIDLHLKGLEAMGAQIKLEHGYVDATAPSGGLRGAEIVFALTTVTGTENLMMAACLAKGTTVLKNAALEPEVIELANVLKSMGAKIQGAGTDTIQIEGRDYLEAFEHEVDPDRIEAGTFMAISAITGGDITLRNVKPNFMTATIECFVAAGCKITEQESVPLKNGFKDLRIQGPEQLLAVDVSTAPYPDFATDMQAQFLACMTVAKGTSRVDETIFENRFMHVLELSRMRADISLQGHTAVVTGVGQLSGAPVMATDLRASASLVVAALRAQGTSEILRIYHLDRGYVRLEEKLKLLGAKISRVKQA